MATEIYCFTAQEVRTLKDLVDTANNSTGLNKSEKELKTKLDRYYRESFKSFRPLNRHASGGRS